MYIDRFWENLVKIGRDNITSAYLIARLELLESYWKRFLDNHDVLLTFDGIDGHDYMTLDLYGSTENTYISAKTKVVSHLTLARVPEPAQGAPVSTGILKHIQLPRLNLPTFSGELLSWEGFRDLFKSLVHDVEDLAPIQKLQYLKASTTGEAAAAIANIEMSSAGYALTWEELTSRYDNKRVLAAHMRALLTSQAVIKTSAPEIKRLITVVNQASQSFKSLGRPVDQWDDWFVHLLVEKLDASTRLLWESSLNSTQEFPRFGELTEFLQNRVRALEAAGSKQHLNAIGSPTPSKKHQRRSDVYAHATAASPKSWDSRSSCPLCREQHALRACAKFKAYPVEQRRDCIRKRRACFNCLGSDHNASSCPPANRCRQCQSKHHTVLHFKDDSTAKTTAMADGTPDHEDGIMTPESTITALNSTISVLSSSTRGCVLLATARVILMGESGRSVNIRALLDSGSEASFVSERAAQLLKLPRRRVRVAVSDLQGAATGTASHAVSVMIGTHRSPSLRIAVPRALVLPKLTSLIPGHRFAVRKWPHLDGFDLADPEFAVPAAVDCVLGSDIYGLLCERGRRIGPLRSPSAHQTIFGWVLMGPVSDIRPKSYTSVSSLHITDLNQDLQRFWKLDEVPEGRILTPEEKACEDLFVRTHTRDGTGRYIMRLPRKEDPSNLLGTSRLGAFRLLQSNERRLGRDQTLRHKYREFMSSYISLGHMEVIPRRDNQSAESFYMPHHAVIKHSDSSDKIRVVFNASYRSSSGVSLNDLLVSELWLVLTR